MPLRSAHIPDRNSRATDNSDAPVRPLGQARVLRSRFQVVPPSVERYRPLPGPPLARLQGVRRASQSEANRMLDCADRRRCRCRPCSHLCRKLCPRSCRRRWCGRFRARHWGRRDVPARPQKRCPDCGIDDHFADRAGVAQADVLPGLAAIERLVNPVAVRNVSAKASFARAHVNDIRVRLRDRQAADRGAFLPCRKPRSRSPRRRLISRRLRRSRRNSRSWDRPAIPDAVNDRPPRNGPTTRYFIPFLTATSFSVSWPPLGAPTGGGPASRAMFSRPPPAHTSHTSAPTHQL